MFSNAVVGQKVLMHNHFAPAPYSVEIEAVTKTTVTARGIQFLRSTGKARLKYNKYFSISVFDQNVIDAAEKELAIKGRWSKAISSVNSLKFRNSTEAELDLLESFLKNLTELREKQRDLDE